MKEAIVPDPVKGFLYINEYSRGFHFIVGIYA